MKIIHTNPNNFEQTEIDVDDYQYSIAQDLRNALTYYKAHRNENNIIHDNPAHVTDLIVIDENVLSFGFMRPRNTGSDGVKYKITIERVTNV